TLLTLAAYSWLSPKPDFAFAKVDARNALPYLLLLASLLVGLNYCGGLALTLVFTRYREGIAKLYASDLIGASLGCLASVSLMWVGGPIRAFLLSGLLALIWAALLQMARVAARSMSPGDPSVQDGAERKGADRKKWMGAATIALSLLLAGAILRPDV